MSLLNIAARRATPMLVRAGRHQLRSAHSSHFDAFGVDSNNKLQMAAYYAAICGALCTPILAIRYQVNKIRTGKKSF